MRSGTAQRQDGAPGVTRRVLRLLVLLSAVLGAYLLLSLLSHAARADAGSTDHLGASDAIASAETAGANKVVPKTTAPKDHPVKTHRSKSRMPPKIQAPKSSPAPKIQATRKLHISKARTPEKVQPPRIRAGETAQRVRAGTSKFRQTSSDAVRNAVRATVTPARTAAVRQKLPSRPQLGKPRDLPRATFVSWTRLRDLPQSETPSLPKLRAWPQAPSWPPLPGLPQAQLPRWAHVPGVPPAQLPAWPHLPGPPFDRAPVLTPTTALGGPSGSYQPLIQPAFAPAVGLSGVTKPPAAPAQPLTGPLPAPARQPADRSNPSDQVRDSGGGDAPAIGAVSSSWQPEVAAAGRRLATDLIARGRTLRYAGPPS
jgi:hypothetical protein